MSIFKNSKQQKYTIPLFDKLTNSEYRESKCDLETFKSYIKRDLENLLNARALYSWKSLHKKPKKPKELAQEYDPNAPADTTIEIEDEDELATPEDSKPQRAMLNFFEYGISDYSAADLSNPSIQNDLAEEIKCKIETFEPRLKNISVEFITDGNEVGDRVVRFKIEGTLNVEEHGEPEDVQFDTSISPFKKMFSIE